MKNQHPLLLLLGAVLLLFHSDVAPAPPLVDSAVYGSANPDQYRRGTPSLLTVKGTTDNEVYVLEADPVTGAIPTTIAPGTTVGLTEDHDYGAVGGNTLRTAAQIGNINGPVDFGHGAVSGQTLRSVSVLSNGTTAADFGSGPYGVATLRVVLPTDQTPVPASQSGTWNLNDITGTISLPTGAATEATLSTLNGKVSNDYGLSSGAVRTAAQLGNATGSVDYDTGPAGTQTPRSVLATRHESVATPLAAQISNGSTSVDFGSGPSGTATMRTVLATRHEDGTTPLAVRLSDGTSLYDGASETTLLSAASSLTNIDSSTGAISGQLPTALGQTAMSGSLSVTVANDQSAVPISAASLPLPSGAATEATLSTLNGKVTNNYGVATGAVRTASQIGNAAGVADFGAGNVTAQTLRVQPSNDAVMAILSSNYTVYGEGFGGGPGPGTVMLSTASHIGNSTGAADFNSGAAGAQTLRTVLATRHEAAATPVAVRLSDGASFDDLAADVKRGRGYVTSVRNDYSSTNVTTGAWVQLIASTPADLNGITLFDSCGNTLELGTGAAASETRVLIIPPGGIDGFIPLRIPSGTRVSVRAVSANCTTGELNITAFD